MRMPITKLNKDYEILKDKESFIFMLRHAEKQVYPNNSGENSISITEKGRIDSENFGREFARIYYVISLIKSSPIKKPNTILAPGLMRDEIKSLSWWP